MDDKTGGPAFPGYTMHAADDGTVEVTKLNPGMTQREYLAAKFAAAWLPILAGRVPQDVGDVAVFTEANRLGLAQADAMIAARSN